MIATKIVKDLIFYFCSAFMEMYEEQNAFENLWPKVNIQGYCSFLETRLKMENNAIINSKKVFLAFSVSI